MVHATLSEDRRWISEEVDCTLPRGGPVWLNVGLSPLTDDAGQTVGATMTVEDLTERKRLLEENLRERQRNVELQAAQRALEAEMELERHRALSQMVAGVAHELNTPLGTVNAAASILKRALTPERLQALGTDPAGQSAVEDALEALGLMERNIRRAHKLIQDFRKISVSQVTDTKERLDIGEAVADILGLFKLSAKQSKLEIEVRDRLPAEAGNGRATAATSPRSCSTYSGTWSATPTRRRGRQDRHRARRAEAAGGPGYRLRVRDFGAGIPPKLSPRSSTLSSRPVAAAAAPASAWQSCTTSSPARSTARSSSPPRWARVPWST